MEAVWSPDGRELFYRGETDLMVAQVDTEPTFSSRTPEVLFDLSRYLVGAARDFDLAPDGERFIFLKSGTAEQTSDDADFSRLIFVVNWFEELTERVPVP